MREIIKIVCGWQEVQQQRQKKKINICKGWIWWAWSLSQAVTICRGICRRCRNCIKPFKLAPFLAFFLALPSFSLGKQCNIWIISSSSYSSATAPSWDLLFLCLYLFMCNSMLCKRSSSNTSSGWWWVKMQIEEGPAILCSVKEIV